MVPQAEAAPRLPIPPKILFSCSNGPTVPKEADRTSADLRRIQPVEAWAGSAPFDREHLGATSCRLGWKILVDRWGLEMRDTLEI